MRHPFNGLLFRTSRVKPIWILKNGSKRWWSGSGMSKYRFLNYWLELFHQLISDRRRLIFFTITSNKKIWWCQSEEDGILTVPLVPSLTGLNDGCPWGLLMNGFTERLAFVLAVPLLGPAVAPDPLLSCIHRTTIDWLSELKFYIPLDTNYIISEKLFPANPWA